MPIIIILPGRDQGFFRGKRYMGGWLVPCGYRIHGVCLWNVAIWRLEPKLKTVTQEKLHVQNVYLYFWDNIHNLLPCFCHPIQFPKSASWLQMYNHFCPSYLILFPKRMSLVFIPIKYTILAGELLDLAMILSWNPAIWKTRTYLSWIQVTETSNSLCFVQSTCSCLHSSYNLHCSVIIKTIFSGQNGFLGWAAV